MFHDDLITVILPIYNVEKYLQRCISTVIKQSYKNLEIILVDDGSTDQSGKICDENAKIDNRIIVIHKENGGLSDARNAGIDIATGKYIAFIDSDDYVETDYIERLYGAIIAEQADVSICSFFYVDEADNIIGLETIVNKTSICRGKDILERALTPNGVGYVVAWNKLYKRELFRNLRYEKGKVHEDEFINYKLFWNCNNVVIISNLLYNYRQRNGSIQGTKIDFKRIQVQEEVHLSRIDFYKKNNEKHLTTRSLQSYFNWATRCFATKDKCEILPIEYRNQIQSRLRNNLHEILFTNQTTIAEKAQDIVASVDIVFAGRVKGYIKR